MIVVAGEALVDLIPGGSSDEWGLPSLVPRLGGGPYNAALSAARLGVPTSFFSRVSTDPFGEALLRRLRASGVATSQVQRGHEPTTLAVVTLNDHGAAQYGFYTDGTADRLVGDPGELAGPPFALSLGTLGMVLEPGVSSYEAVLRREHQRGVLTVLDPNIRGDLIADPPAYRKRFEGWLPHLRLLKLSVEDAAWLADSDLTGVSDAVRRWVAAGVGCVVLTHGGDGLSAHTAEGEVACVASSQVPVVDTIGAGDTVQGALLAWLAHREISDPERLSGEQWGAALRFAAAAAAVTVSRQGAEPPTFDELAVEW